MELKNNKDNKNYMFRLDSKLYDKVFKGLNRGKSAKLTEILKNYIKGDVVND